MITIDNPQEPIVKAILLKGNLRMFLHGLKHSRMSGKEALQLTTNLTGNAYKRGQYDAAIADLVQIIKKGRK